MLTGIGQGFDFGMGKAYLLRKAGTDHLACFDNHAADPRVGIGEVEGLLRCGYSQAHEISIVFGEHTHIKTDLSAGLVILVWVT